MASGNLGKANLTQTTNTIIYTVPASITAAVTVSFCNRTTNNIKVRLAISDSVTPGLEDYIEYDTTIPGNGVLERTGIIMSSAKKIVAHTDIAGVSVNVYGIEE